MVADTSDLEQNVSIYETLIDVLAKPYHISDAERDLQRISLIAGFAWRTHPGRFVDIRLDYWTISIGKQIWERTKNENLVFFENTIRVHVLHVVTETYNIGGHTRFLLNLIKGDSQSVHSLVLVRQKREDVPEWLSQAILSTNGSITSVSDKSLIQKVACLQHVMCTQADKIFYHVHPDDSVAIAALAATPRPKVMAINHADHVFWLGSSLVDIVVCYREYAVEFSLSNRAAKCAMLLPTPLSFQDIGHNDKYSARKVLGINFEDIIILTVASANKFIPSGKYNYFKTIKKILDNNPRVLIKIIGVDKDNNLNKYGFQSHERIELLGLISNPKLYYQAADIYIDSMPLGSFTSLLEAMYFECFPVLPFCPVVGLNVENEPAFNGLVKHTKNEYEQVQLIQKAIVDSSFRNKIAEVSSRLVMENYIGEGWKRYLFRLYDSSAENIEIITASKLTQAINIATVNDIDAATLSNSTHKATDSLLFWLSSNINVIGFFEIAKIFHILRTKIKKSNLRLSIRQFAYLIKSKAKSVL